MKRLFFLAGFLAVALLPCLCFSQQKVNVHIWDIADLAEDSSGSTTWLIKGPDSDTSAKIIVGAYTTVAHALRIRGAFATGTDSLSLKAVMEVSLDGTYWARYDSVAAITTVMGVDSVYVKKWTLPPTYKARLILTGNAAHDVGGGVNIYIKTMRQQ